MQNYLTEILTELFGNELAAKITTYVLSTVPVLAFIVLSCPILKNFTI